MKQPEITTLCYIEAAGKYLMMHRVKKKNDINKDKWIGVGGHFEYGESPDECLIREVLEETGLMLTSYKARGIVTFIYGSDVVEYMHLYTADGFTDGITEIDSSTTKKRTLDTLSLADCDEGELVWIKKSEVYDLPIWEGDKIFFRLLEEKSEYFSLKLVYSETDELVEVMLDGNRYIPNSYFRRRK